MKIVSYIVISIALITIGFNIYTLNLSQPFEGNNKVAVIGIISAVCAIVLMLLFLTSRKIAEKLKQ